MLGLIHLKEAQEMDPAEYLEVWAEGHEGVEEEEKEEEEELCPCGHNTIDCFLLNLTSLL